MDFCHISPTKYLTTFCSNQRSHLLLAHLVEDDPVYRQWYIDNKNANPETTYILDNSAFELFKQGKPMYKSSKLIEMGKAVGADYIVMSDYPNEPWEKTRDAAELLGPQFKDAGFGTFYCPQSTIGNLKELIRSYWWAAKSPLVDYIGFSILAIPNAYSVERDNKLQRFCARWKFMLTCSEIGLLQKIYANKKKVHMLGMVDGPNEILLLGRWHKMIDTWDSSAAVWAGLNNISFDQSPTGLINGKFETHVDFNHSTATDQQIELAKLNINYIDSLF